MLVGFIIVWVLTTLVACTCLGIIPSEVFANSWIRKVIAVAIAILIGFIVASLLALEKVAQVNVWNDGHCEKCNIKWRFTNAAYIRNKGQVYYYTCDKCGKVIRMDK